ncbi:MAG: putative membrane protein [Natronomonas sp.]|jgi:putative membrane protein
MQLQAREHVPVLTGILTTVSLALVFGAVLGAVPDGVLPHVGGLVSAIPHINAVLSLTAIGTISYGVVSIRRGEIARHRRTMLASTGLFALFLLLYLYRISLEGPTTYPGPELLYQYVYLPMLAVHILLAVCCIPVVYYALLLAITRPPAQLSETNHPRAGRIAAALWLVSFTLGVVVYLQLYVLF